MTITPLIESEFELSFDSIGTTGVVGENDNHDPARRHSIRDRLIPRDPDVQVSWQNPTP